MTKKLENFEEEIYKCSRCGLCQSVCPVYKVTLNECSVSKAKFTMLNGIIKGDLVLNEKIKNYMDLCTGCNACKNFCPSDIDAREIFTAVKSQYYALHKPKLVERIADSYFLFKSTLHLARISFSLYRFFKIDKLADLFYGLLSKIGLKRVLLLNSLIKHSDVGIVIPTYFATEQKKAVYFAGCFNNYLNPSSKNALKKIFNELNIDLEEKKFECCGIAYLSAGKTEEYEKLAIKNLEALGEDFDYVLTDCASCAYTLKEYEKYFPCAKEQESAQKLAQKTINVLEFLKDKKIIANKPLSITVHKPCHEDFDIVDFVKNIQNVQYVEAEGYDECCGFSGKFALKYPEISKEISKRKSEKLLQTRTDCIITTCPACALGINQGLIENATHSSAQNKPVYNLIEFIALTCTVRD